MKCRCGAPEADYEPHLARQLVNSAATVIGIIAFIYNRLAASPGLGMPAAGALYRLRQVVALGRVAAESHE